jgi:regulator of RNase E activity RraA
MNVLSHSSLWNNDEGLFALVRRELFTAVVGDIMDKLGARHQFLPPQIRPLRPEMVTIGRAMTVLSVDVPGDDATEFGANGNGAGAKPFGLMLEALDDLKPREIYLCAGSSPMYALWGELMSARAMRCGAAGAIVNGYSRDTHGILALDFPTFSYGSYAQDQAPRGRVVDFRVPLDVGAVRVSPGDIVFGDIDGVCAVPRAMENEVFARALEKARGEKTVRHALEGGLSAKAAFETYGIM